MKSLVRSLACLVGSVGWLAMSAMAEPVLPAVFSDHMVLQRERDVAVWGIASAGETVRVSFRGTEASARAGEDGKWRVQIASGAAGGPFALIVAADSGSRTIQDVLVGEVWVGSGQSNMAGGARAYAENDPGLAAALGKGPFPRVRLYRSQGVPRDGWTTSGPEEMAGFSALLLSFGLRLEEEMDVPVGLIVGAVGGTVAASWLSEEALAAHEPSRQAIAEFARTWDPARAKARYERTLENWEEAKSEAVRTASRPPRRPVGPVEPGKPNRGGRVGDLYERLIRPFAGYSVRGVLWDQGEAGSGLDGVGIDVLMAALIDGWRKDWRQERLPWIYLQKPSGGGPAFDPDNPVNRGAMPFVPFPVEVERFDGDYRAAFQRIAKHPDAWMVPVSDLAPGVHPPSKSGYGHRAAQVALHAAYGKDVPHTGPVHREHRVEGDVIRITFDHVGEGLVFRGGESVQGFQVAGGDGIFRWASAGISGTDAVVVRSAEVPDAQHVRYAWARNHPWANLFSSHGWPALGFSTE